MNFASDWNSINKSEGDHHGRSQTNGSLPVSHRCTAVRKRLSRASFVLPSEDEYQGRGVSACATCDGFFYRDKDVVVVGGGNTAVEEALFLTKFASKVTLVHRRDSLRAEKLLQQKILSHPKTDIIWDSVVKEILGTDNPKGVTGVLLENTKDKSTKQLDTHGVFVAI